jgi:GNAT superfamily N-acetyltransferase
MNGSLPGPERQSAVAREAGHGDVDRLADVLAAAFYDDPVWVWLLPEREQRREQLRRFFALELRVAGLARGTVQTTDGLPGAALSLPPGQWHEPWPSQLRNLPAYLGAFGSRLPMAIWLLARVESRHPRQPHHYFAYVGVTPEQQGRGIGSALMRPTLNLCDQAGLPAYLEASTARSAALYQRLGFEQTETLNYGGSQPLRLMLRPAPASRDPGQTAARPHVA